MAVLHTSYLASKKKINNSVGLPHLRNFVNVYTNSSNRNIIPGIWIQHQSILYGPRHNKTCLRVFATKQDSNQSPQLQRLARKLKFHLQTVYIWYFLKSELQRLWSDSADEQAGLRLCCSQPPPPPPKDRFSQVKAHIDSNSIIGASTGETPPSGCLWK